MNAFYWIALTSYWIVFIWLCCGMILCVSRGTPIALKARFMNFIKFIYHEIKPFYWPCAMIHMAHYWLDPNIDLYLKVIVTLMVYFNWKWFKDVDKDDRWKRRKQKLLEKVKVQAGKLVAVPVPA